VLGKPQGSSPTLTPPDANTTTLSGLSLPGPYIVKAKCCNPIGDIIVVVAVEVDIHTAYTTEADEETVGLFVPYNDDDDDSNGIEDRLGGGVSMENETRQVFFSLIPSLSSGEAKLEATAGPSNIKVFEDYLKSTEVTLPKTWNLSSESLPPKRYVEGYATSSSLRDTELKLSYIRSSSTLDSDKVKITVIDVDYTEDTSQTHGYDSYTNAFFPYKSVKVGASDTAYADISGTSTIANEVYFTSSDAAVTVSPSSASGTHQQVTFTGVSEGFAQGLAKLHDPAKDNVAASIGVYPYDQDNYTVAVRVIHEEDDDVQAMTPGTSGSSETDVCVSCGANGKRDTIKSGDDVYSGENILVGPDKVCDTTRDNTPDNSTDPFNATASDLAAYLNDETYNQAIVNWSVTKLDPCTVNFDLDCDGDIDVSSWTTAEMDVVINKCKDTNYEYNIFIVNNPSDGTCGYMKKNQMYGFVHPDECMGCVDNTTAHELGHGAFELSHADPDADNLMDSDSPCPERLRKGQWITIQSYK
jgi:hypothetical protein